MRYIGRTQTSTLVQIDADRNSYVNVKSFGAAGLDRYFEGRVRGLNGNGGVISVGDIPGYSQFEKEYFQVGQELYAFFYLDTSTPPVGDYDGIFTNIGTPQGVGTVVQAGTSTSKVLRYYVYALNVVTGRFSPYVKTFTLPDVYRDPQTQFDEENYVRFTLNRATPEWVPVIYRQWGTSPIKFLGVPSNNIFGGNTTITFSDRGSAQVPSWDEARINGGTFNPELLDGIISISSGIISAKTIIVKRRLKIINRGVSGILECSDAESNTGTFIGLDSTSIKVKFRFDDTKPLQEALNFAANNQVKDVFVPTGTYSVRNLALYSSVISASQYSSIVIRGAGDSSVLKRMPTHTNPEGEFGFIGMLGSGVTNRIEGVTVRNLAFDGNKTETFPINLPENDVYGVGDKYHDSLALEYADGIRISECSFYNGAGSALYALDSDKVNFTNNRVFELSKPYELNISPLKIRESSRIIAQGNLFQNCSGPVDFTGIDASLVNNNIIDNCGETGIQLNASDTWNAQGNLTFNESGSIIRSVDLYQNEYSRVSLDVKRGVAMTPIYFTVTDGGFPVALSPGSVVARVYPLNSSYQYNTTASPTFLQVVENRPQLEAGIFAVTAPVTSTTGAGGSNQGRAIRGTNGYDLLKPDGSGSANYGYGYKITSTVTLGKYAIERVAYASSSTVKVYFRNSSDILSLLFFAGGNPSNDSIKTSGIGVTGSDLSTWPDATTLTITEVDTSNSAIVIATPSTVAAKFTSSSDVYSTPTGYLGLVKNNYFIADGNVYVSE
jgi:hypothetical protein